MDKMVVAAGGQLLLRLQAHGACGLARMQQHQAAVRADTQAPHIWDLPGVRGGLAELGLDWEEPPHAPGPELPATAAPLMLIVHMGDILKK
jgi:hypothetical protein